MDYKNRIHKAIDYIEENLGETLTPKGMISYKVPPSKYAVFTHSGPISAIQNTVKYIWGT